MTVFSKSRKSVVLLNSSISVRGLGGAVYALIGMSLGNSNSSSEIYYAFFPLKLDFLKKVSTIPLEMGIKHENYEFEGYQNLMKADKKII
jgi:hypothetical protein